MRACGQGRHPPKTHRPSSTNPPRARTGPCTALVRTCCCWQAPRSGAVRGRARGMWGDCSGCVYLWALGCGLWPWGWRWAWRAWPRAAGRGSLSLSHVCHERELKTTRTINHPGHGGTDARAVPTRRVTGPSRTLRPPASAVPAALGSGSGLLAAETRRLLPRIARRDCSARSAQRGERGERGISRQ